MLGRAPPKPPYMAAGTVYETGKTGENIFLTALF
jgi:hypothetical protein